MSLNKLVAKPLPKEFQQKLIEAFKARLNNLEGLTRLYLIGSAARLEMTDTSDLDFVAVFEEQSHVTAARKKYYMQGPAEMWPCDVLWYSLDEFLKRSSIGGICMVTIQDGLRLK